jgi:excisionase family DNA binding protein
VGELLLTINQASERLSIGRSKLYELLNSGAIPVIRIGRAVRVPAKALDAWVEREMAVANDTGMS